MNETKAKRVIDNLAHLARGNAQASARTNPYIALDLERRRQPEPPMDAETLARLRRNGL